MERKEGLDKDDDSKADDLPEKTKALQETIRVADWYLIVSPEYNHSVPPAFSS